MPADVVFVSVVFWLPGFLARELVAEGGDFVFTGVDLLTKVSAVRTGFLINFFAGLEAAFFDGAFFFGADLVIALFGAFFSGAFLVTAFWTGVFLAVLTGVEGVFLPVAVLFFTVFSAGAFRVTFLATLPEAFSGVDFLDFD
ncbi:MAG: hypothetical protein DRP71_05505 [Verrucomicrobia bacterium]|nr:MAG: hypothetical protein DRP71_05505 [Verrucomicrobiota bacterium]